MWLDIFACVILILSGVGAGILIQIQIARKYKEQPLGTIHIETSDPDGPYMFLELEEDILHKEEVLLRVDTKNYISHD